MSAREMYIGAVYLIIADGSDRILLLRRYQTGYEDGSYSLPAGHIESGESPTTAIIREAAEEIGIEITADDLTCVHVTTRHTTTPPRVDFFFVARRWHGEPANREPDKCDDLRWVAIDELPENTIPYIRDTIVAWKRGDTFSEK